MGLNNEKPFPKRPRLNSFDYIGSYAYFITLLTKKRSSFFTNSETVGKLLDYLKFISEKELFKVEAYCFMPDHLHLLVSGESDESNLKRFVSLFKQKTGYWFAQKYQKPLWHSSYYDHILRKEEDKISIALYVLENPVRKALVNDYRNFEYSGSLVHDLKGQG